MRVPSRLLQKRICWAFWRIAVGDVPLPRYPIRHPRARAAAYRPSTSRRLALGNRYPVIGVRADALEQPTSWEKETLNFYPPIASSRVPPLHR